MDESCHMYGWVMSHIWMSHVTHMDASCHTYGCVMSHIWMSHGVNVNKSCHTYECVISHIWIRHVAYMDESITHMSTACRVYEWVNSQIWIQYTHIRLMRDATHESSRLPGVAATAPTHRVVNRNEQCREYGCAISHDSKTEHIAGSCCNSDATVMQQWCKGNI